MYIELKQIFPPGKHSIREMFVYSLKESKTKEIGEFALEFNDDSCYISNIEIHQEFRGRGFAHIIMNYIEITVKFIGLKKIFLFVDFDNEKAQKLYLSHGYKFDNDILQYCYRMSKDVI